MHIYILKDPVTHVVRYVGQTNDIKRRLDRHVQNSKNLKDKRHVSNWIRSLSSKPIMEVIDTCDYSARNSRELYWIDYYKQLGADLCNHSFGGAGAGIGNTNCVGRVLSDNTKSKLRKANKQSRKTIHISTGRTYPSLKEACTDLNIAYVNEFTKLKRGTSKTFAYLP
jgi:hypothetical protein